MIKILKVVMCSLCIVITMGCGVDKSYESVSHTDVSIVCINGKKYTQTIKRLEFIKVILSPVYKIDSDSKTTVDCD